jgi:glycosyltransferase involved in cell wall biosynthesis
MRILFALSSGDAGGAELALVTHLRHLPSDVRATGLLLSPGPIARALDGLGVPAAVASLRGRPSLRQAAGFERTLARELRRVGPDLVLAVGVKSALLCAPVARALRVPLVWQKVDLSYDERLSRPLSRLTSGVIAISAAAGAAVHPSRLLGIVPPPVRLPDSFVVSEERPPATLGSLARLQRVKGHHHLIEAAGRLRPKFPELRVLIAGAPHPSERDYGSELRATARRSGVEDRVELLGHVENVRDVLERLTVYVGAAYRDERGFGHEGLGVATIEASWAALPVVVTDGGGSREAVKDGVTGTLVPPAAPAALADAIDRYLSDPGAARAAGDAGRRYARARFRPAEGARSLFELLRGVAEAP